MRRSSTKMPAERPTPEQVKEIMLAWGWSEQGDAVWTERAELTALSMIEDVLRILAPTQPKTGFSGGLEIRVIRGGVNSS